MPAQSSKEPKPTIVRHLRIILDGFLVLCLLVAIAVFLYGLFIAKTSPQWSGVLLAASGILITGVILSFFLKAPRRMDVALPLFSSLISLFALNVVLRYYDLSPPWRGGSSEAVKKAAERAGVKWDTRSKLDVVNDIRDSGWAAYPGDLASAYATDNGLVDSPSLLLPLGNISFATIVPCNESGPWVTYQSDRYGFNNDDAIYKNKGLRVLLIGDSFAQGECVKQEKNVAGWLGHYRYSTVNLGISGSGPLLELARLREYGSHLAPDIVVWLYFKNDPDYIASEYRFPLFRRYLERFLPRVDQPAG